MQAWTDLGRELRHLNPATFAAVLSKVRLIVRGERAMFGNPRSKLAKKSARSR